MKSPDELTAEYLEKTDNTGHPIAFSCGAIGELTALLDLVEEHVPDRGQKMAMIDAMARRVLGYSRVVEGLSGESISEARRLANLLKARETGPDVDDSVNPH